MTDDQQDWKYKTQSSGGMGGGGLYGCVHVLVGGEKVYECKCEWLE